MLILTKPKEVIRPVFETYDQVRGECDVKFFEAVRRRTSLISDDNDAMSILIGPMAYHAYGNNIIVEVGRRDLLRRITGIAGASTYLYGAVGTDTTGTSDATRTRLGSELIAGTNRIAITDTGGGSLDDTDIVSEVTGSNRLKLTIAFQHGLSDPNNGNTFAEWGVFDTLACPGSPTGTSGKLFARFSNSGFSKDASFISLVNWIWRS